MKLLGRIVIVLLILLLVGCIWLCAYWEGKIKTLANTVETDAGVLQKQLAEVEELAVLPEQFRRGEVLSQIQQEWARGTNPKDYPVSIINPPPKTPIP